MSTHLASYRTIDDSNGVGALLDMIARRAPVLMRQGGGALRNESEWIYRHLASEDRAEILRLYRAGLSTQEIMAKTGWSYKTVWNLKPKDAPDRRRLEFKRKRAA